MILAPLPGEYIASAIRRGNETLGIKGVNKKDYYIKRKANAKSQLKEEDLIEFPTIFEKHQITEEVLYQNTLYPLAAALGRTQAYCVSTPTTSWKICLNCVVEDIEIHGAAYIHHRNLLTSVSVCSVHASKLYERCPACLKSITSHEIQRLVQCSKFFKITQPLIGSPPNFYAKFVKNLLDYDKKIFTQHHAEIMICMKLQTIGYLDKFRSLDIETLKIDINNQLSFNPKFQSFHCTSLNVCATSAFLAYQTADEYLTAMKDDSAWKKLREEIQELRTPSLKKKYAS